VRDAVTESIAGQCHEKCNHCRVVVSSSLAFGLNENVPV
jgi:hypothetical protein